MIYAKIYFENGKPIPETLEEHTKTLLKNLSNLKKYCSFNNSKLFQALKIACLFHDLGKISSHFQKKINKILKINCDIPKHLKEEIPHNFLSGIFLYIPEIKSYIINKFGKRYFDYIFYAVVFHHERSFDFSCEYFEKVIEHDINNKIYELEWLEDFNFKIKSLSVEKAKIVYEKIKKFIYNQHNISDFKKDKNFIFIKGMLHRLDHSSSAKLNVEEGTVNNLREKLINYLAKKKNFSGLKKFQKAAKDFENKSIILTASTGMGKTEFALNWIGDSKAFYVLPLRVSVNTMFERCSQIIDGDKLGLLYGDSFLYGIEDKDDEILLRQLNKINMTRQLSMPFTVTTADQIFTSVFKFPGYEKVYATLMYSKIVLDEPQAYSPDTIAYILKGLQELSNYGGKFCLMSATIHPFIKEKLKEYCELLEPAFNNEPKHKISIQNCQLDELMDKILKEYENGKRVLIITNTVKKSQDLFKKLKSYKNVKLLHSGFILKDRKEKEKAIISDYHSKDSVIWISTQLVEASLDIDYDVLFTEIASFDALIQRMGRIYRRKGRKINKEDSPNIFIAIENPSDNGFIYDNEIVKFTKEALKEIDGNVLKDREKQRLMDKIFNLNKIKNTKFYKTFKSNYEILHLGYQAENKKEAQTLFRKVSNVNVIPIKIYEDNEKIIEENVVKLNEKNLKITEKIKALNFLNQFIISVPCYKLLKAGIVSKKDKFYIIDCEYSKELGLIWDNKEIDNII